MPDFYSLATRLVANGYHVIPILPRSKLAPLAQWQQFCWRPPEENELAAWAVQFPSHGLGLACGFRTIALDIDCRDERTRDHLVGVADELLARTPLARVGQSPRIALIYACAEPIIGYRLPQHEILGVGAQVVIHGTHEGTGQPYRWTRESTPWDTRVSDLPAVTQNEVAAYVRAIAPVLGFDSVNLQIDERVAARLLTSRTILLRQMLRRLWHGRQAAFSHAVEMLTRHDVAGFTWGFAFVAASQCQPTRSDSRTTQTPS